mmetsp:Transcript_77217/g.239928  ORF Transcript_77217/g.239928 Transcript_77217/m.239928 type:complete len:210 (-) Transcript_77217:67-696(-)
MLLSRNESLRMTEPSPNTAAIALAPASPMRLSPRHSSPMAAGCNDAKAKATALAPLSPKPRPLNSSSGRRGGARRHSERRATMQTAQKRARSPKVGSRSMMACRSSAGISGKPKPARAPRPRVEQGLRMVAVARLGGPQPGGYEMTQARTGGKDPHCCRLFLGLTTSTYHGPVWCVTVATNGAVCVAGTDQLPRLHGQLFKLLQCCTVA